MKLTIKEIKNIALNAVNAKEIIEANYI